VVNVFTLLIFQGSDSVSEVRTIRADDVAQARRTAELIMRTQPAAAGHQLWRDGVCISRTYPTAYPSRSMATSQVLANNENYQAELSDRAIFASSAAMFPAGE
jgi:hypothetical protein